MLVIMTVYCDLNVYLVYLGNHHMNLLTYKLLFRLLQILLQCVEKKWHPFILTITKSNVDRF